MQKDAPKEGPQDAQQDDAEEIATVADELCRGIGRVTLAAEQRPRFGRGAFLQRARPCPQLAPPRAARARRRSESAARVAVLDAKTDTRVRSRALAVSPRTAFLHCQGSSSPTGSAKSVTSRPVYCPFALQLRKA